MQANLTEGKVPITIMKYSIPLLLSMLFQQMYSLADSVIAGKAIGMYALSAIGISFPITSILISVATGFSSGSAILISQFFGAGEKKKMQMTICSSFLLSLCISIIMLLVGSFLTEWLLQSLHTPSEIYEDAYHYLGIYMNASIFIFIGNMSSSVFIALGNSKIPLYTLIITSIANIILDCLFVAVFSDKIMGIAYATWLCQLINCLIISIKLVGKLREIGFTKLTKYCSKEIIVLILNYSIPTILQSSFVSVGNIVVQRLVNSYGTIVIAAYTSVIKLNTVVISTIATFSNGLAGFIAQNRGAGKVERMKDGYSFVCRLSIVLAILASALFLLLRGQLIGIFLLKSDEIEAVIREGSSFFLIVAPFYIVVSLKIATDSVLKGVGAMKEFMIATFADLLLRVALSHLFSDTFQLGSVGIWMAWPVGWSIGAILSIVFYKRKVKQLFYEIERRKVYDNNDYR